MDGVEVAGGGHRATMRGFDDRTGISVPRHRAEPGQHAGIVGDFLIGAERPEGTPGDRIEPVQRQHAERDPVGDKIVPRMVAKLMRQRQIALVLIVARDEIAREGDIFPHHPERERAARRIGFDQMDTAIDLGAAHLFLEHAAAETEMLHRMPAEEHHRPDDPQPRDDRPEHHETFDRGGSRAAAQRLDEIDRDRVARRNDRRRCRLMP